MYLQYGMRAGTRFVGMSGTLGSTCVSLEDNFLDLFCRFWLKLDQAYDFDGFILANGKATAWDRRIGIGEQVSDFFVVDFEEGDHDFNVMFVSSVLDALEKVGHCKVDDTRVEFVTADSVCFSTACGLNNV